MKEEVRTSTDLKGGGQGGGGGGDGECSPCPVSVPNEGSTS